MKNNYLTINYIKVKQPIGTFYIGTINWRDLLRIAMADIRQINEKENDKNNFDSYMGIQRKISPKRITEISQYVTTVDATFPTSIILAIDSVSKYINGQEITTLDPDYVQENLDKIEIVDNLIIDNKNCLLRILDKENIAKILDGQHRIEGIKAGLSVEKTEHEVEFELNVTIFVDLDLDDQAQIFSVINKAQTKVNKSLVYDLYDYANSRSPQKTAHDIVRLLNKLDDSPFYKKIKILGTAENIEIETIAQATFVETILQYISKDPMRDRDVLKRKKLFGSNHLELVKDSEEKRKRIFRNLFIMEKDEVILAILFNYFKAIQTRWPISWNQSLTGNILNKTTGLIALMRFLKPVCNSLKLEDKEIEVATFLEVFNKIDLEDNKFSREKYVPGSSGQSQLYHELISKSGIIEY
jgi:DGQHR domain-containing protein